jgi:hypothetical protein
VAHHHPSAGGKGIMKIHALAEMAARAYLCKYKINSERCPSILRKNTRSSISRPKGRAHKFK